MTELLEFIRQPWHWAVGGTIIGLIVPLLLILGNKKFGISSSLRHICAATVPGKNPFLNYDWRREIWSFYFIAGVLIGGGLAVSFLQNPQDMVIAEKTKAILTSYGITDYSTLLPKSIFHWQNLFTLNGFFFIVVGGFMVGFGTRWAGGCTSGHSIMGISSFQWPSLLATIFFMLGGIIMTHFILPLLF